MNRNGKLARAAGDGFHPGVFLRTDHGRDALFQNARFFPGNLRQRIPEIALMIE